MMKIKSKRNKKVCHKNRTKKLFNCLKTVKSQIENKINHSDEKKVSVDSLEKMNS